MKIKCLLFVLTVAFTFGAHAVCETEEYRQFDFWLGKWKVTVLDGSAVGYNSISKSLNDCVIKEEYKTPSGYKGSSLNSFDVQTGKWHQTWMDNGGLVLKLDGNILDGSMVMFGNGKTAEGKPIQHRITWTPNKDKSVRQHWQTSENEGKSWSTVFDGRYTPIDDIPKY